MDEDSAFAACATPDRGGRRDGLDPMVTPGLPGVGPWLVWVDRMVENNEEGHARTIPTL